MAITQVSNSLVKQDLTISGGSVDNTVIGSGTPAAGTFTTVAGTLASTVTGTTQAASDNSTKVATTAYVTTALANLVDSAPGTLNTLNELAAALGDDASFATTVTNSIATKLPLAGGTLTGDLAVVGDTTIRSGNKLIINRADNAIGGEITYGPTGTGFIINDANGDDTIFKAGATEHMRIDGGTGNVGIGASSPDSLLELETAVTNATGGLLLTNTNASGYSTVQFKNTGGTAQTYTMALGGSSSAFAQKLYIYDDTDGAARVVLDHSGNVGIGVSSPAASQGSAIDASGPLLLGGYINSHQTSKAVVELNSNEMKLRAYGASSGTGFMTFATGGGGGSADSERMRIDSSGNVGIAASGPTEKLEVRGSINTTFQSTNFSAGAQRGFMDIVDASKHVRIGSLQGAATPSGTQGTVELIVNGGAKAVITPAGEVSIGNPNGDFRVDQKLGVVGAGTRGGISVSSYIGNTTSAVLDFNKSRHSSPGNHTIVQDDDALGVLIWRGDDGTQFVDSAAISANVDATPGVNDMPGRLEFFTSPDGTTGLQKRFQIDNGGNISFMRGTSGAQGMYWENQGRLVINTTNALHELVFAGGDPADILYQGTNYLSIASSNNVPVRFYVGGSQRAGFNDNGLKMMAGHGIEFSASTPTPNTGAAAGSQILDDYEEGTWTPTLPNGGTVATVSSARYTKIGGLVQLQCYITCNSIPNNGSQFHIGGLPYTPNVSQAYGGGTINYGAYSNYDVYQNPIVRANSAYIYFHRSDGNASPVTNSIIYANAGSQGAGNLILILNATFRHQ